MITLCIQSREQLFGLILFLLYYVCEGEKLAQKININFGQDCKIQLYNITKQSRMIVLEKLQKIESGLEILRVTIFSLSLGLLFLTLFNSNQDFMVSLIISIIAALLYMHKHLSPTTYRIFILLLLIDCIYCGGHFVEKLFSKEPVTFLFFLVNTYTVLVIILFIIVLWRHYQLNIATELIEFSS